MNEFDVLIHLAQRARNERGPELDVAQRVVRRIERQTLANGDRGLKLVLATTGLLSLLGLVVLFYPARDPADPLIRLSRVAVSGTGPNSISRVLQP